MSNDPIPTHDEILALCRLVGDSATTLTAEQRDCMAELLDTLGSAVPGGVPGHRAVPGCA